MVEDKPSWCFAQVKKESKEVLVGWGVVKASKRKGGRAAKPLGSERPAHHSQGPRCSSQQSPYPNPPAKSVMTGPRDCERSEIVREFF